MYGQDSTWYPTFRLLSRMLAFAVCLICAVGCRPTSKSRGLCFASPSIEVRLADLNGRNEYTIVLENHSDRSEILTRLETTCSCTVNETELPQVMKPRSSLSIRLRLSIPSFGRSTVSINAYTEGQSAAAATQQMSLVSDEPATPSLQTHVANAAMTSETANTEVMQDVYIVVVEEKRKPPWIRDWQQRDANDWLWAEMPDPPVEVPLTENTCQRMYRVVVHAQSPPELDAVRSAALIGVTREPPEERAPRIEVVVRTDASVKWIPHELVFLIGESDAESIEKTAALNHMPDWNESVQVVGEFLPHWMKAQLIYDPSPSSRSHYFAKIVIDPAQWREAGSPRVPSSVEFHTNDRRYPTVAIRVHSWPVHGLNSE